MISVIVPVYRIEKYIEKCIKSICDQTFTDWELLLINDGSTDSSEEICRKWADTDTRIRLISKENGGVSSARNLGIQNARGEFLFFLDGDDWISPDCLEAMYEKMSPQTDVVISEWEEPAEDGYEAVLITKRKNFEGILSKEEVIRDIYDSFFYPKVVWGKLFRKSLWEDIRLRPMIYSEDTYAMLEVLQKVRQVYSLRRPLYFYLQRGTGVSQTRTIRNYQDYLITLEFKYTTARTRYPQYQEISGEEYIREAYILLEMYEEARQKKPALELISKMQEVYRTAGISQPIFSQKILRLPKHLMYHWITIRKILKGLSR